MKINLVEGLSYSIQEYRANAIFGSKRERRVFSGIA